MAFFDGKYTISSWAFSLNREVIIIICLVCILLKKGFQNRYEEFQNKFTKVLYSRLVQENIKKFLKVIKIVDI